MFLFLKTTMPTSEVSEVNSYCYTHHTSKRARYDDNKNNYASSSSSSSKFKGVVQQQNGHWGAQIYANHQRIWLGTFKTEEEAAMAYDSATVKLRNGDSQRNFPLTDLTVQEPDFQNHYTTEAVLNMIKDGSYSSYFLNYLERKRKQKQNDEKGEDENAGSHTNTNNGGVLWRLLFQKELTPSDVGKLNRLVIPKKYAIKYFPKVSGNNEEEGSAIKNMRLNFYDRWMRVWKFRYCYWSSSQSFVFTRGWNKFVKEKVLRPKDVIIFYMCESTRMGQEGQPIYVIDIKRMNGDNNDEGNQTENVVEGVGVGVGVDHGNRKLDFSQIIDIGGSSSEEDEVPMSRNGRKCVKLFGVDIS